MKKAVVDEEIYPENYRKSNHVKGNNFKTPDPFVVARIVKFREDSLGLICFFKFIKGLFMHSCHLYGLKDLKHNGLPKVYLPTTEPKYFFNRITDRMFS